MNADDFMIALSQHLCSDLFPGISSEWFIVVFDDEIMVGLNFWGFFPRYCDKSLAGIGGTRKMGT